VQIGGLLKDWTAADVIPSLGALPAIVLRGETEELYSTSTDKLLQLLPSSATVKSFQGAGSYAHIDAWEAYLETVNAFLEAHD